MIGISGSKAKKKISEGSYEPPAKRKGLNIICFAGLQGICYREADLTRPLKDPIKPIPRLHNTNMISSTEALRWKLWPILRPLSKGWLSKKAGL